MKLRPDQTDLKQKIYDAWNNNARAVMAVHPTGGGKTVITSDIFKDFNCPSIAMAHRQELISQISLTFARFGIYHRLVAPKNIISFTQNLHRQELNRSFYNPDALVGVGGVDTIIRQDYSRDVWVKNIKLAFVDEGHHVLRDNKWGRAFNQFPNALQLLMTASPRRADGKGLGRDADGIVDTLVESIGMRGLIEIGALTEYKIFAPPSDFNVAALKVGSTGDYNHNAMKKESQKSHIVGDVVEHYLKFASGKQGITFATDIETAGVIAARFNDYGVRAEAISANTPDSIRAELIRRFRNAEIQQLVNVDLFGEGFDVPAVEVVSMARPTQSWAVYSQQFGRMMRPLNGKKYGLLIDHVDNVRRMAAVYGLPDTPQNWTLAAREKGVKRGPSLPGVSTCLGCYQPYDAYRIRCPHCGAVKEPGGRTLPEQVDGDLCELTPAALAELQAGIDEINEPAEVVGNRATFAAGGMAGAGVEKQHRLKQEAQFKLRDTIAQWGGIKGAQGLSTREQQKLFYLTFGVDVMSAQALKRADAVELNEIVRGTMI